MNFEKLNTVQLEFSESFKKLQELQDEIKEKLVEYSDNKTLKGDELVGWLGEIFSKEFFNGELVDDSLEHDFIADGKKYSVKARKGTGNGWQKSSLIRSIAGGESPDHLVFVHFNNDYSVDRIWLFDWDELVKEGRLKEKTVRGIMIGWQFSVRDKKDVMYVCFRKKAS